MTWPWPEYVFDLVHVLGMAFPSIRTDAGLPFVKTFNNFLGKVGSDTFNSVAFVDVKLNLLHRCLPIPIPAMTLDHLKWRFAFHFQAKSSIRQLMAGGNFYLGTKTCNALRTVRHCRAIKSHHSEAPTIFSQCPLHQQPVADLEYVQKRLLAGKNGIKYKEGQYLLTLRLKWGVRKSRHVQVQCQIFCISCLVFLWEGTYQQPAQSDRGGWDPSSVQSGSADGTFQR
mmetsp:Transcript_6734/g.18800  ORF Transcript_6734/g.18800 Transcript_6734/m.18800 type:complete len:227 (-) Transcript_6734:577-1257(-)